MICIHFNLDNTLRLNLKVHGYMNKYNYCYLKMSAWYIGIKIIICSYTRENLYLKSIKKKSFFPSTQTSIGENCFSSYLLFNLAYSGFCGKTPLKLHCTLRTHCFQVQSHFSQQGNIWFLLVLTHTCTQLFTHTHMAQKYPPFSQSWSYVQAHRASVKGLLQAKTAQKHHNLQPVKQTS